MKPTTTTNCEHDFEHMNQEEEELDSVDGAVPEKEYRDVFFCRKCLFQRRIVIRRTVPNPRKFGGEITVWEQSPDELSRS